MEYNGASGARSRASNWTDEPRIETRRYLDVVKRGKRLVFAIVVIITLVVLAISLVLPKSYSATATVVYDTGTGLFGPPDAASTERQLSTIGTLIDTTRTDAMAAEMVPGTTIESIESATSSSVDQTANLIHIEASSGDAEEAAQIANAVAVSFLKVQREFQEKQLVSATKTLEAQLEKIGEETGNEEQAATIQNRINHLQVQAASAGSELQLAEPATAPSSPTSPEPLRNTVIAFFAAIFIGILVVLARDQLAPGLTDVREVSRLLRAPMLVGIPYVGKGLRRKRGIEAAVAYEAYQTLGASIQAMLPPSDETKVMLVTSAVHGEGKSTVTSRLGRALAQAGHKTLLISGDLRWPELHVLFNAPQTPGLTDILDQTRPGTNEGELLNHVTQAVSLPPVNGHPSAALHLITSGTIPDNPAGLLANAATESLFAYIRALDYRYILIDGPPGLGIADIQPLSRLADGTIVVARLDRIKVGDIVNLQELLSRLTAELLGVVVIGARVDASPYYLGERRALAGMQPLTDGPPQPLTQRDET